MVCIRACTSVHDASNSFRSLGQLIKIIRETHMEIVVDKLIAFFGSKEDELRDISGLGMQS